MSGHHGWLINARFARLRPLMATKPRAVPRVDDRRVMSGIADVIRNRLMSKVFASLAAECRATDIVMIDAT